MTLKILKLCLLFISSNYIFPLTPEARAKGFVYLHETDASITLSLRYLTTENFLGTPVDGYKKPVAILTQKTAEALKRVQTEVKKDGYELVIYDSYRPQQAVNHFIRWAEDTPDQAKKADYYPRIDKARVFELGYVGKKSSHSRGSTVDLTLKKVNEPLHAIKEQQRTLRDGFAFLFLDDGTIDMGSSFDLFDSASHHENNLIDPVYKERREYLKQVMEKHGFKSYAQEWWHFTLKDEPYPAEYFDFPVE